MLLFLAIDIYSATKVKERLLIFSTYFFKKASKWFKTIQNKKWEKIFFEKRRRQFSSKKKRGNNVRKTFEEKLLKILFNLIMWFSHTHKPVWVMSITLKKVQLFVILHYFITWFLREYNNKLFINTWALLTVMLFVLV